MHKLFPGYFRPTDEEFKTLWQQGVFAFDANVLLNIYRYTPKTRGTLLEILSQLQERLWLPHQAAYEYHQNRLEVITHQLHAYAEIEKKLDEGFKKLETELRGYQRHPFVDVEQVLETLKRAMKRAKSLLQRARVNHPDLLASDDLREQIVELFEDNLGAPFPPEELEKVYKQAEQRFKQDIPPGFEDTSKKGAKKYGDVVLWFQLIKFAKEQQKPLIFTTDDRKEDWWLKHDGGTIGPRPELIQEMRYEASIQFYMYSTDQFMKYAQDYLKLQEQQEAVEEVREIRRQDERSGVIASQLIGSYPIIASKELNEALDGLRQTIARTMLPVNTALQSIALDMVRSSLPIDSFTKELRELAAPRFPFLYGQNPSDESSLPAEDDDEERGRSGHPEEENPSNKQQDNNGDAE